jgi:outer membrane protein TolC
MSLLHIHFHHDSSIGFSPYSGEYRIFELERFTKERYFAIDFESAEEVFKDGISDTLKEKAELCIKKIAEIIKEEYGEEYLTITNFSCDQRIAGRDVTNNYVIDVIKKYFIIIPTSITSVDHHLSHAQSAFYQSPYKEAVVFNSISAFGNLYKARAAVELVKEYLEQSNKRVQDFSNLEKNGLLARNDLLKAELQSSNIELTLLDVENNLQLASVNMALMLGLPEKTILIPDSASLIKAIKAKSFEEYEQQALTERKEIGAIILHKKIAELGVKTVKADYYPGLALTAGYLAANVPGFLTITNAVNLGVGVKYSLSSIWKTKTKLAAAGARVQQLASSELMLSDQIRLQVNETYQAYKLSEKRIQVYQKALVQSTENFRIIKNKYENTLATATDLLEAEVTQLQSRLMVVGATVDAIVAFKKLLQTAGILTP